MKGNKMIIYKSTKKAFIESAMSSANIADLVKAEFEKRIGKVNPAEYHAWKNSLRHMAFVVDTDEIADDASVCIEYRLWAAMQKPLLSDYIRRTFTREIIYYILCGSGFIGRKSSKYPDSQDWNDYSLIVSVQFFRALLQIRSYPP